MFRNYYHVRDWLEEFIPLVYGKEELGLQKIANLLEKLDNPQKKFKSIHVAGTSGKGSTSFYIANLLKKRLENGRSRYIKVGLHISPHLVDIRERLQINGEMIPIGRFIGLFNEIKPIVEAIKRDQPQKTPSYFEILVAGAFKYFADEKVDFAVVEVGLGGRLDATNVLVPEVSVITNIGLDHTEILGDTTEKIAFEKAGIIKKGIPVVTGATGNALKVIEKVAKDKNSLLYKINTQKRISGLPKWAILPSVNLALKTFEILYPKNNKKIYFNNQNKLIDVFLQAFPGRLEEIDGGVILDGAHNPDKIKFLTKYLNDSKVFSNKRISLVVGFKQGKNWRWMVRHLLDSLPIVYVVATEYQAVTDTGKGSAVDPKVIVDYIRNTKSKTVIEKNGNSQNAVISALNSGNSYLLVTGSLYLVGEVRTIWHLPNN